METTLPVRVYYDDTDFTGIIYHANYLKYFERGRTEALREMTGINHASLLEGDDPAAFTVRHIDVTYEKPGRIDDLLEIRTIMHSAKGARMIFHQTLWRDQERLAQATVEIAFISMNGKPKRMPKAMLPSSA